MCSDHPFYVLITVCRNEEAFLGRLIEDVGAQTVLPHRWFIVDDGSTDQTHAVATAHAQKHPFISIERMPAGGVRSFSSKVFALRHGCALAARIKYEFLGVLDADLRLKPDYFERLLRRFKEDSRLGIAGGSVLDQYPDRIENIRQGSEDVHVAGGVHFLRRACFEDVGGYLPIDAGGEDTIAEVTAMMHGWRVHTFDDLQVLHLRPEGFGSANVLTRGMKWGRRFYLLGYHPLYYVAQCVRRVGRKPILVGSFCQLLGFAIASLKGEPRPVSPEFIAFFRKLQMNRLSARAGLRRPNRDASGMSLSHGKCLDSRWN